jgi:hypothetical protein
MIFIYSSSVAKKEETLVVSWLFLVVRLKTDN